MAVVPPNEVEMDLGKAELVDARGLVVVRAESEGRLLGMLRTEKGGSSAPSSLASMGMAPSSASLLTGVEQPEPADSMELLPKLRTAPTTSRRLRGVLDLLLCALCLIPYLLITAFR